MAEKNKHIGLRCTEEVLTKLKYITQYRDKNWILQTKSRYDAGGIS